jgi:cell wall-associated NlpC family hydrolase
LKGINLPRDAYQQMEIGQTIEFVNHKINDLVFFKNNDGKIIHVGLVVAPNKILHASGMVRIDALDETGIFNNDLNKYTHFFSTVKRIQ